jgi:hypothetical protein
VDVLNFDMAVLQSHEFVVGAIVAAILLSALFASSLFRNIGLALAAGGVVVLYLQGGIASLLALSHTLETEFKAIPDFSSGMIVGTAVVAVLMLGFRPRAAS